MEIRLAERDLASRSSTIQRMLRPISPIRSGPACGRNVVSSTFIWGTHDGSPARSGYRDWRFATIAIGYAGSYFELWKLLKNRVYYLDRAYLTIYFQQETTGEQEYLALHCDPNEPDTATHSLYKKGPHLHIKNAEDPIPKAHLALNKDHLPEVLKSASSLTNAIESAILMIKKQVLDEIVGARRGSR